MDNWFDKKIDPEVAAIENLKFDVQIEIQKAMNAQGVCITELARRLKVSDAAVHRYFSESGNMTLKTIARIEHALGVKILFKE